MNIDCQFKMSLNRWTGGSISTWTEIEQKSLQENEYRIFRFLMQLWPLRSKSAELVLDYTV